MSIFRIDVPAQGKVIAQKITDDSTKVMFIFNDSGKEFVELVEKQGIEALFNHPDAAHLQNIAENKTQVEICVNADTGTSVITLC
ncbi:hypothetical protein [Escherichia coli]|uniref:hypothetical protein n=1 Tax=Escherichia coli TaxID=562 RepID=UPI0022DE9ED6|nr:MULTISPECIES: hypothetical protein [Enterobacteriaceae]MDK5879178.1 hypothetical protein [Citrobacter freundii]HCR3766105.1 hypothetical protein [Citrobacter freundii]